MSQTRKFPSSSGGSVASEMTYEGPGLGGGAGGTAGPPAFAPFGAVGDAPGGFGSAAAARPLGGKG